MSPAPLEETEEELELFLLLDILKPLRNSDRGQPKGKYIDDRRKEIGLIDDTVKLTSQIVLKSIVETCYER
jgi:hypothetical protein